VFCIQDRKTALYWAVEKGNYAMVKLILGVNPDLEIATKVRFHK
jgi:ankyrin repeat protein